LPPKKNRERGRRIYDTYHELGSTCIGEAMWSFQRGGKTAVDQIVMQVDTR
jgi:hypothetical protein